MTKDFENMLYLFGANANGLSIEPLEDLNVDCIRKYAIEQGIWTMVFPQLNKMCDANKYYNEFISTVSTGILRREFTLNTIKELEENGIKCCILKGTVVSGLYKNPDCRISSDVDIIINPDDEEKVKLILQENGYRVDERAKTHHHLTAHHDVGGLLEVHVRLYSEITEKIIFNNINACYEPWETIEINGEKYHTLGVNDNLMYLTSHYIKHLINDGGGVRQMMDLLLYIEANKERIDFERYNKVLKELKYDNLIDIVKSIGGKYFGFNYDVKNQELVDKVLTDTEIGGIFGKATKMRQNFFDEYCKKRTTMSKTKAKIFLFVKMETGFMKKMFPSQKILVSAYGYKYAKYKIFVPIAWIHRYVDVIIGKRKPEIVAKDTKEFADRMNLMRELGMID